MDEANPASAIEISDLSQQYKFVAHGPIQRLYRPRHLSTTTPLKHDTSQTRHLSNTTSLDRDTSQYSYSSAPPMLPLPISIADPRFLLPQCMGSINY
ncbi:hypothetical protein FRC15_000058 [Serendipita sp. 397]|nr:hypothetical protein FRC15_000058 [Serendipita sp. 397]